MPQLSKKRLIEIIKEEVQRLSEANGNVDHVAIKDVVSQAADMITAIAEFKEEASPAMIHALTPHLENVEKALKDMVSTPGSYVTSPKKEPRVVSLRSTPPNKNK